MLNPILLHLECEIVDILLETHDLLKVGSGIDTLVWTLRKLERNALLRSNMNWSLALGIRDRSINPIRHAHTLIFDSSRLVVVWLGLNPEVQLSPSLVCRGFSVLFVNARLPSLFNNLFHE